MFDSNNENGNITENHKKNPNIIQNNKGTIPTESHFFGNLGNFPSPYGGQKENLVPLEYLESFKKEILEVMKTQTEKKKEKEELKSHIEKYATEYINKNSEIKKIQTEKEKRYLDELKLKLYKELEEIKKQKVKIFNEEINKFEKKPKNNSKKSSINNDENDDDENDDSYFFEFEKMEETYTKPKVKKKRKKKKKKYIVGDKSKASKTEMSSNNEFLGEATGSAKIEPAKSLIGESKFIYPKNHYPKNETHEVIKINRGDSESSIADSVASTASAGVDQLQKKTDERMKRLDAILVSDSKKDQEVDNYLDNISTITETVNKNNVGKLSISKIDIYDSVSQIGEETETEEE